MEGFADKVLVIMPCLWILFFRPSGVEWILVFRLRGPVMFRTGSNAAFALFLMNFREVLCGAT